MVIKKSCRTFDFEQLLFLEIFELLHKFGSNLALKANGNSEITVNSVHRLSYMAGNRLRRSRRARGGLGFALARERLRHGFSLLPWPSYKALEQSLFFFSLALFSRRPCSSPASSHRRYSVSIVAVKRSIASPTPGVRSHPTVVD